MYGGGRSDSSTVATRQQAINTAYDRLVQGAELRRKYLEEAIRLFGLIRECDEVEVWIREKVGVVTGSVNYAPMPDAKLLLKYIAPFMMCL